MGNNIFELGVPCRSVHQQPNFCSCLGTFEHIGTIAIPLVVIDLVDVEWINCVHFIFNNGYCMYRVLIKPRELIVQFSSRFTYNVFVCACLNTLLGYFRIPIANTMTSTASNVYVFFFIERYLWASLINSSGVSVVKSR